MEQLNIISTKLVTKLQSLVMDISPYLVELSDGFKILYRGMCKGCQLELKELTVRQTFSCLV